MANNSETDLIKNPVREYVESWYDSDAQRMKKALHPVFTKRHPDDSQTNGLRILPLDSFLEIVPGYGGPQGTGRQIDIEVFDQRGNIAAAKVVSNLYTDYIHLGFHNNSWKIINVLWDFKDEDGTKITAELKQAISEPVYNYVEGWYDKDKSRLEAGLHPDLAKRSLDPSKPDGIFNYTRKSLLEDLERFGGPGGSGRTIQIDITDVCRNIASAIVVSNSFFDYIHLVKQNGKWLIVNVIWAFLQ